MYKRQEAVNAVLNPDTNIWTVTEESDKDITVRYAKADDDGYYYLYADESCAGSKICLLYTSLSFVLFVKGIRNFPSF